MLKIKHSTMIFLSGLVWLIVGCALLMAGTNFIVSSILTENADLSRPLLDHLAPLAGGLDQAALVLIALSLIVGFAKARFVFSKTVNRSVKRVTSMPNPSPLSQIYPLSYYLLLLSMGLLGFLVRFTTLDVRGSVDVIIGFALIRGAIMYFRQAWLVRQKPFYPQKLPI